MNELVSVKWLNEHLNDSDLIILDVSLQSTVDGLQSKHELLSIPGARYFDLKEKFSDKSNPFPNTLPTETQFEMECKNLGINRDSKIVVFDNKGIYSSPRVWWMFKVMGHESVAVLDGGLPEWINHDFATESKRKKQYDQGNFKAHFQEKWVKSYQDVLNNIEENEFCVVDARSEGRFNGIDPEPRKHLKSGQIPRSVNLPYTSVLKDNKYKPKAELQIIFEALCDEEKDLVFSCGSGLTACIILLARELVCPKGLYLYDGSWTEWAELQNLKHEGT